MRSRLEIPSAGEWTFQDDGVADNFDAHVHEQLPWYDTVTEAIGQIGRHYITDLGTVYDLGAATGNVGRVLASTLKSRAASFVAIDNSREMVARYNGPGYAVCSSIVDVDYRPACLIVANLVLMFLAPADAVALLDRLIGALEYGGALIIVERFTPPAGYPGVITSRLTLDAKRRGGASADEIIDKELALTGVQRPLDRAAIETRGGVEWFRFGDFSAYLIENKTESK